MPPRGLLIRFSTARRGPRCVGLDIGACSISAKFTPTAERSRVPICNFRNHNNKPESVFSMITRSFKCDVLTSMVTEFSMEIYPIQAPCHCILPRPALITTRKSTTSLPSHSNKPFANMCLRCYASRAEHKPREIFEWNNAIILTANCHRDGQG